MQIATTMGCLHLHLFSLCKFSDLTTFVNGEKTIKKKEEKSREFYPLMDLLAQIYVSYV